MPASKTERILVDLVRRIESGEYPPGSRLPSRARMAAAYGVSEQVIRIVAERLKGAGLVESVERGGYYVRQRPGE